MARRDNQHQPDAVPAQTSPDPKDGDRAAGSQAPNTPGNTPARGEATRSGGPSTETRVAADDHTTQESFVGTDRANHGTNASWGAIFAGALIFLALMVVFGLISGALGLSGAGGLAVTIWSIIAMLLALAAAGFVAGALAGRAGLLHGLVTWAASLVGILVLVGWIGASILGAVGGALGGVVQGAAGAADVTVEDVEGATDEAQDAAEDVDQEQVEEAQDQAGQAAQEAQGPAVASAWGTVAGLILGATVAGFAGVAGARTTLTKRRETVYTGTERRHNG